jgi:hypothetical protein
MLNKLITADDAEHAEDAERQQLILSDQARKNPGNELGGGGDGGREEPFRLPQETTRFRVLSVFRVIRGRLFRFAT